MPAPTEEQWLALDDDVRARRLVAARALCREAERLVGLDRTAEIVLKLAGRSTTAS